MGSYLVKSKLWWEKPMQVTILKLVPTFKYIYHTIITNNKTHCNCANVAKYTGHNKYETIEQLVNEPLKMELRMSCLKSIIKEKI